MPDTNDGKVIGEELTQFVSRIERLNEEKSDITSATNDVYFEAKSRGFDVKVLRQLIKERGMTKDELDERDSLIHLYRQSLGMQS